MDWDKMTTRVRGASAFWRGLGKVVPIIQQFSSARLGDGTSFRFWLDEWSDKGCLRGKFPQLFCDNPTPAMYSQRLLGRRVEPVSCGSVIRSKVGGVFEYAADVGGVEA